MARTEAGKRLLERRKTGAPRLEEDFAAAIDAIEAEARNDWAGASLEQGRAEGAAAERARIRAAVEAAFDKANKGLEPNEEWCLSRAAVLAVIDKEDTDGTDA